MRRSVGICPVCETKQRAVRAWHDTAHAKRGEVVVRRHDCPRRGAPYGCAGTGMLALPTPEQQRRQIQRSTLIEPFRAHAAVAMDAIAERRPYPVDDVNILCRVACRWYQCCYLDPLPTAIVRYVSRKTRNGTAGSTGDVYCVFCGVLLFSKEAGIRYADAQSALDRLNWLGWASNHAVECALKHLAFGLVPAAPDVRRLPEWAMDDPRQGEEGR